jgi:hypothetical protein
VIGTGAVRVLYYWHKEFRLDDDFGTSQYTFSNPNRDKFVEIHGKKTEYRSNRDFIRAFDPGLQQVVSVFIRKNKIRVVKTPDTKMAELVNFCNAQIIR